MGKWKVCVYAICKNEAKFVRRWMDSMREADWVVVLDTGSDDGTPEMLRKLGAQVTEEIITPWRFDVARNRSLELVPEEADICVCTDLDEVFRPGWRAALEAAWTENTRRARYRYTWNFNPDGSEGVVFWTDKIHARHGFRWVHPVHEVLEYERPDYETVLAEACSLTTAPTRPSPARNTSPLLELSVREAPLDDRNTHYLGREYMFHRRWKECIETLTRHLALPTATWPDERCASMRFIARAHEALGNVHEAEKWLFRAVGEAPHLREPWVEMRRSAIASATGRARPSSPCALWTSKNGPRPTSARRPHGAVCPMTSLRWRSTRRAACARPSRFWKRPWNWNHPTNGFRKTCA